ncbi:MAG: HNH endonuclease [Rhizobiales bacterium]|nr:HNH endonuclease [Hyphomicrobiales bacterium]
MASQSRRDRDALRRERSPHRKLYDLAIWRGRDGLRQQQLARQPLCERCLSQGKTTPATTVNHRKPHKGDWSLFVDPANHESACKEHHDSTIKAEENRGYVIGTDVNGRPIDPNHPWNARHRTGE